MSELKLCNCCEEKQADRDDGLCNSCAVYIFDEFQSEHHDFSWNNGVSENE